MNAWQRLGIEPTTDLRHIKKAYAKQLKLIDQDTQPNEFIELRQAFNEAQYEANYLLDEENDEDDAEVENHDLWQNHNINESSTDISTPISVHDLSPNLSQQTETQFNAIEFKLQLQECYDAIEKNIREHNIHFDIPHALHEARYLLDQDPLNDVTNQFRQRILDLLTKYQLEDFITIIQLNNNELNQSNKTKYSSPKNFNTDQQASSSTAYTASDLQPDSTPEISPEYSSSNTSLALEEITHALWQSDLSDHIFEKFEGLLNLQTDFNLSEQIWTKDQLQAPLANVDAEILDPRYTRFLDVWLAHYPDDLDHYQDAYQAHQLQEKMQYYIEHRNNTDFIPRHEFPLLELLEGDQPLQSNDVLTLKKQLDQRRPDLNTMDTVAIFNLRNTETNYNFIFLKALVIRKNLFWLNCFFALINFIFLEHWFNVSENTSFNASISIIGGWTFYYFIQPYLLTFLATQPNQPDLQRNISLVWFISGIFLCAFSVHLNSSVHLVSSYVWVLLSQVLMAFNQLRATASENNHFQYIKFSLDSFMIRIALFVIMAGIIALFIWLITPSTPWSVVFSLIPIALLLFPDSFKPLLFTFGRVKKLGEMTYQQFITGTVIRVLLRFMIFFAISYFLVSKASQPYFYVVSACILSLCLALSNTAWIANLIKILGYLIYTLICLVFLLKAPIIGIVGLWLLFYIIYQHKKAS